jgi:uridine kinase
MTPQRPLTIGVAGGSGSGKTTVARTILNRIGRENIAYVPHDSYYRDRASFAAGQHAQINFDHPDSLDTDLFIEHIRQLQAFQPIPMPVYDFATDSRTDQVIMIQPQRVVLIEGILIYTEARLRELFDVRLFVDTDDDVRFIRRLQRDVSQRGRTLDSVVQQWMNTVRPMHLEFVEPSKRYAHVIIPEGGRNEVAMQMVVARIQSLLEHR